MASDGKNRVCPVERAGSLDSRIRRWIQNPRKMLKPYLEEGMTVLDLGCGPGFFSMEMAEMVGRSGRVIASDLQEGMLQKLGDKIRGTELRDRVTLHRCEENRIGVPGDIDFVLAFYVVHEIPDKEGLFREIHRILKPDGRVLVAEPPFHVSRRAFSKTIEIARNVGLTLEERPSVFLSKTAVLKRTC